VTWAPVYETAANLRTYMRMDAVTADATDIAQDTIVHTPALTAASRAIDRATSRQFGSVTVVARYYTARWDASRYLYTVSVDDIQDVTGLAIAADLDASGNFATTCTVKQTLPLNAIAKGGVVTDILFSGGTTATGRTKVTAVWGWTAVPAVIKEATLLQASRIVKRRDAPFGVAGSPEFGNELRLLPKLDPDVEIMVQTLRRYW